MQGTGSTDRSTPRPGNPRSNGSVMHAWRGPRYPDSHLVSLVARYARPHEGPAVVVGCGNGRHVKLLNDLGFDAFGIEPDPEMARAARANGIAVVQTTLEAYEPRSIPNLVVAWGLMMVLDNLEPRLAHLQAPVQIINWRSEDNSYLQWNADGPPRFDHGLSVVHIDQPGYLLDGQRYCAHLDQACHLPGYERVHCERLHLESDGVTNAWRHTVHRLPN